MKENDYFEFDALKQYVSSLMPQPPITYVVQPEQQNKEIALLNATLGSRRFFFVTNLENFEIEQSSGIERWLGYSDREFKMKKYLDFVVHPGRRKSLILVARQVYDTLCRGEYSLNFMVQRYNSLVALKHYNGNYLLANKISAVFQYDVKNRLTAYLNEFTIIGDYDNQPMSPVFFTASGEGEQRGEYILKRAIKQFLELGIFTDRQFQIARELAYQPGITKSKVAHTLGISVHTVDELGDRFLIKARDFFQQPFSKVSDAALHLRKEGLL